MPEEKLQTLLNNPEMKEKFGLGHTTDTAQLVHDICAHEVRYICSIDVDCVMQVPGLSDGLRPGCRGERVIVNPDSNCSLIVTCADEVIRPDCSGVDIRVGIQLAFGDIPTQRYLVMDRVLKFTCTSFKSFPDGATVSGSEALKTSDGSCVVVDLRCMVLPPDSTNPNPRIRIYGKVIDKLWKEENLWILAVRPYDGVTVKKEFPEPHKIGGCSNESPECPFAR